MRRTSDNERSNPISRAFAKFFERGRVARPDDPSDSAHGMPGAVRHEASAKPTSAATAPQTGAARDGTAPSAPSAASVTPTATATPRRYTVVEGDSLSTIAQRVYGRADRWTLIFDKNRDTISDPDRIHPGQVLVLPEIPTLH